MCCARLQDQVAALKEELSELRVRLKLQVGPVGTAAGQSPELVHCCGLLNTPHLIGIPSLATILRIFAVGRRYCCGIMH
jgi:hypothetical protein